MPRLRVWVRKTVLEVQEIEVDTEEEAEELDGDTETVSSEVIDEEVTNVVPLSLFLVEEVSYEDDESKSITGEDRPDGAVVVWGADHADAASFVVTCEYDTKYKWPSLPSKYRLGEAKLIKASDIDGADFDVLVTEVHQDPK